MDTTVGAAAIATNGKAVMGRTHRLPPALLPRDPNPDEILADVIAWLVHEARSLREGRAVLAGDMDACRRVVSRHQTYANFAAGAAYYREGQAP